MARVTCKRQTQQRKWPFVSHPVTERRACHTRCCWNPSFGAHGSMGHMDDLKIAVPGEPCFFLCCGHMAKFFLLSVAAASMRKVHPNFVVAALIFFSLPKRAIRDGEGSMHPDLPFRFRARRFQEAAYISPVTWYASWSPQLCGAGLMRRRSLPEGRRHAAPLKSPATISICSCLFTVRNVSINFFPKPSFLALWLLMCKDTMVKKRFAIARYHCGENNYSY